MTPHKVDMITMDYIVRQLHSIFVHRLSIGLLTEQTFNSGSNMRDFIYP